MVELVLVEQEKGVEVIEGFSTSRSGPKPSIFS
jgi:hypothetical protein